MSSEKFEFAQDEVETQLERLSSNLRLLETSQGEARKRNLQVCEKCVEDGEKLLEEMDGEARTAPLQFRAEMLAAVRGLRSRLGILQSSYRSLKFSSRLTAGEGSRGRAATDGVREKVINGVQSLERTGESIYRSQQVAIETEQVGVGIIDDLGTQRESLERTRTRLVETDVELGRSSRILKRMYLNVISNKIILSAIIIIEVCILIGLVYWKYFSKKS